MFSQRYDVLLADDSDSLAAHHRLRYQVYCVEKGYEDPGKFPSGQEMDDYDGYAVHLLARERSTGQDVATLRLVLPKSPCFPCERVGGFDVTELTGLPRNQIAEISRVCLTRPAMNGPRLVNDRARAAALMRTSHITLSLYQAVYAFSLEHGINHWLGFTTPAMRRLLLSQNMQLEPVGPARQHRGERQAYLFRWTLGIQLFGSVRNLRHSYQRASQLARTQAASVA